MPLRREKSLKSCNLWGDCTVYTKERLMRDLAALGIRPDDTVFVHSSVKAAGPVDGGADTILDALLDYLRDGLLVFPTHTWNRITDVRVFDARNDPSCVGLLSNLALKRPGCVRSLNPSHSVAAFGRDARAYVEGDARAVTPLPRFGTMGQLIDRDGVILLLGCSPKRNTFLHCVEEALDIPDRIDPNPYPVEVVDMDGNRTTRLHAGHFCNAGSVSDGYDRAVPLLLHSGAMWTGMFGDALVFAERAARVNDVMGEKLRENPDFFTPEPEERK